MSIGGENRTAIDAVARRGVDEEAKHGFYGGALCDADPSDADEAS